MTRPEVTGRDPGQLGPTGAFVASPTEAMIYLDVGRAKLYDMIRDGELQSYVEGSHRKITWPSIHALIERRLASGGHTPAARRLNRKG
jgi:excisionase family DNA binding protein